MAVKKSTVKNFYRALVASAYVAGATAAGAAFGGPAGAAAAASAATASLASPLGVASVEIAAETGAEYAVGAEKMADKKLSKAFRMANEKLRKKNGQLKKGKTQADVARMAQRLRKKM